MRTLRLVTSLAVAGLIAGTVAIAATPASAATAVFSVTNSWGSGYQGQVTVTNNTSAQITSWRVEFDLPAPSSISQSWNAQQTTSGSRYTFTNVSWNGTLAAGASTSFGFLVDGSGTPVNCTVNGAACAGGPPPTPTTPAPTTPAPTTPPPTTPPPTTPPPTTGTPVERHGQLRVCGTTMCDKVRRACAVAGHQQHVAQLGDRPVRREPVRADLDA
ncbi:cellulose-binding domain-containing protein [Micromonospora sp. DT41]|uniref:cellulose-binding domain-containing protein n=1 Tax=Micromonospora sp. DT41 TaxID=3393437 RepID=UPI003CF37AF7